MPDDLVRRIRLGEDSVLELKSVRVKGSRVVAPERRDLADELAALANGAGGTLILGVDDATREIQGIDVRSSWTGAATAFRSFVVKPRRSRVGCRSTA